jgi:hypothetical protein
MKTLKLSLITLSIFASFNVFATKNINAGDITYGKWEDKGDRFECVGTEGKCNDWYTACSSVETSQGTLLSPLEGSKIQYGIYTDGLHSTLMECSQMLMIQNGNSVEFVPIN